MADPGLVNRHGVASRLGLTWVDDMRSRPLVLLSCPCSRLRSVLVRVWLFDLALAGCSSKVSQPHANFSLMQRLLLLVAHYDSRTSTALSLHTLGLCNVCPSKASAISG